jgi:hypothetical protein
MILPDDNVKRAGADETEELWKLIRDSRAKISIQVLFNKNLTEDMATFIAGKKNTSSELLSILSDDIRFKGCYKLKLTLCKNPGTPLRTVLSQLKFLRVFDLGDLTKNQDIPIVTRQKAEYSLRDKIPSLPSGVKNSLAKRSSINIIIALLEKADPLLISSCLESPLMTEEHLYKLITGPLSTPHFIKMVADHPQWSLRYRIKYALIRNYHTPMIYVIKFINALKTTDLRELYADVSLPPSSKPYIFNELFLRKERVEIPHQERYNLSEDEDYGFINSDANL